MTIVTKNLGLVKAMEVGLSAPTNTNLIWYDTNVNRQKYYNTGTSAWTLFGSEFIITNITYAALVASIAANTTAEGYYRITDATSSRFAGGKADLGIVVLIYDDTNGVNQVSLECEGAFLNLDFQDVGNYSGVSDITGLAKATNRKVWGSASESVYVNGDICFYNGLHYQLTNAGAKAGTSPAATPLAYTVLPKTSDNVGYITESDKIEYDFTNNWIQRRRDKRGNDISMTKQSDDQWMGMGDSAAAYFQWGRTENYGNETKDGLIHCINVQGKHYENYVGQGSWIGYPANENILSEGVSIHGNRLGENAYIESNTCTADIKFNVLSTSSFIKDNTVDAAIDRNELADSSSIDTNTIDGSVTQNKLFASYIYNNTINAEANITGCKLNKTGIQGRTIAIPLSNKYANRIHSDFEEDFTITGLTTVTFNSATSVTGIADLISENATESINLFSNFPDYQEVEFRPRSGVIVTFVHGSGANQPRCEGGVNAVIDGATEDFIVFKKVDGVIKQVNIGTF